MTSSEGCYCCNVPEKKVKLNEVQSYKQIQLLALYAFSTMLGGSYRAAVTL